MSPCVAKDFPDVVYGKISDVLEGECTIELDSHIGGYSSLRFAWPEAWKVMGRPERNQRVQARSLFVNGALRSSWVEPR